MIYKELIFNTVTGEATERFYTPEEIRQAEAITAELIKNQSQNNNSAKAALLEKLGITEDEAKLLLS